MHAGCFYRHNGDRESSVSKISLFLRIHPKHDQSDLGGMGDPYEIEEEVCKGEQGVRLLNIGI